MPEAPRPDADALLALANREHRGKLKVFLGAAAGVGKTFEMLTEARRMKAAGTDVLVGIVETHGRAETLAQLGDLEILPRVGLDHRGQTIEEFDLDAALARRPGILLLDELAHTNAPGSRHPKRWQDAEELRAAGIEVWTTMNVQHLESLSEPVARITGVRVAETVPDRVLAEADSVELIDIPPAELLERMRQGKVYRADHADRAMKSFFREGNLAALRELALRRTADRVDADVTGYMRANAIAGPWPSGERVLALIGSDAQAGHVVREARRIADALRGKLLAVHVENPSAPDDAGRSSEALRLAETLGAETETLVDTDLQRALLAHARARNVRHLVLGRGVPPWWRRVSGRTLSAMLLRAAGDFSLHLVANPVATGRAPRPARDLPRWAGWLATLALVGLATGVSMLLDGMVPEGALGMVFLAGIVAASVAFGALAGIGAAVLSFVSWNFLFLPPRYTLTIAAPQDAVGVVVFGLVAVLLAFTAGGLGGSVRAARARVLGLRRLVEFSRRLGAAGSVGELAIAVAEQAERLAAVPACVLTTLPPAPGETASDLLLRAAAPADAEPDEAGLAAARWAVAHARPTGFATDTLPAGTPWQFRPLVTSSGAVALVGLKLGEAQMPPDLETDRALSVLLEQAAVAIERTTLIEEAARSDARAETEALRGALLTSLGHDLKTPLTSIRGALETLGAAGDRLSSERRDDLLATATEETARLSRYLANILEMVRIEHGQVAARREPVDLAEAIETAAARAERTAGRAIVRESGEHLPQPKLDPVLLDQILGNLIENALKFSGSRGRVVVRAARDEAARDEGGVMIAVEDDGPGIARADLARIFDPFVRAARADRAAAGTGLGLAICRGLAHAMGGRIAAESPITRDGTGTRVVLRFPA
jgi:two-component system sensor histidine kinase KdpD